MICPTLFLFLTCAYQDDLKALEKALQAAVAKGDAQEASKVARSAVDKGSSEHVKVVVAVLPRAGLRVYWALMETLWGLKTEDGFDALTDEILTMKGKPEARDLAQLVLISKSEKKDDLISRLLESADGAIRGACVDAIVREERKTLIPTLINLLETSEKGSDKLSFGTALRNLTGLDLGPSAAWTRWWEKEAKTFECPKDDSPGSTETVAETLKRNRRTQYEQLRNGNKRRIAVIRGEWDRIETVLDKLEIPYTLVSNDQIVNGVVDSKTTLAVVENCGAEGPSGKPLANALRAFVEEGGAVFASHLSINVMWTVFPKYGATAGSRSSQDKQLVDIVPTRGSLSDPLMREVVAGSFSMRWNLHEGTTFRSLSDRVTLLIEGPELGSRPGTSAHLAGYFRHGDKGGMVAFVAGHFANQETKEGEFTLQNLLLNFLIEAQENFRARGGK